jgi:hypothetical protein
MHPCLANRRDIVPNNLDYVEWKLSYSLFFYSDIDNEKLLAWRYLCEHFECAELWDLYCRAVQIVSGTDCRNCTDGGMACPIKKDRHSMKYRLVENHFVDFVRMGRFPDVPLRTRFDIVVDGVG